MSVSEYDYKSILFPLSGGETDIFRRKCPVCSLCLNIHNITNTTFLLKNVSFVIHNQTMTPKQESKLKKMGLFTLLEAAALGLNRQELAALVKEDKLLRMGRGIYSHPKAPVNREIDFQVACTKLGPDVVVGGLSALFYYNLVEQVPQQVWVLVQANKKTRSQGYRLIRTKTPLDKGIIVGKGYKIVTIERAIVEGFKFATKIGERTAIKAARTAIQQKLTTLKKIGTTAKEIGLDSYITKYFETIIGSIS